MKTDSGMRTPRGDELSFTPKPEEMREQQLVEKQNADYLRKPDIEHRKKEAAKPLYLIRYE